MMQESKRFIDRLQDGRREIRSLCAGLDGLAEAFAATGNTIVAEKLVSYAMQIENTYESVYRAHGEHLSAEVDDITRTIGSTLKAIIEMPADHPLNQMGKRS